MNPNQLIEALETVLHRDCDHMGNGSSTSLSLPDQIQTLNSFAEQWPIKCPFAVGDFVQQIDDNRQGWKYRFPKGRALAKVIKIIDDVYDIYNNEPIPTGNMAIAVFKGNDNDDVAVYTVKSKYFKMYKPE